MRQLFTIGAVVLFGHIAGASHAQAGENVDQAWVTQNLTSMPLAFTKNMGQWDERALFRADAGGATMWITTEGVYYLFTRLQYNNISRVWGTPTRMRPNGGFDETHWQFYNRPETYLDPCFSILSIVGHGRNS